MNILKVTLETPSLSIWRYKPCKNISQCMGGNCSAHGMCKDQDISARFQFSSQPIIGFNGVKNHWILIRDGNKCQGLPRFVKEFSSLQICKKQNIDFTFYPFNSPVILLWYQLICQIINFIHKFSLNDPKIRFPSLFLIKWNFAAIPITSVVKS